MGASKHILYHDLTYFGDYGTRTIRSPRYGTYACLFLLWDFSQGEHSSAPFRTKNGCVIPLILDMGQNRGARSEFNQGLYLQKARIDVLHPILGTFDGLPQLPFEPSCIPAKTPSTRHRTISCEYFHTYIKKKKWRHLRLRSILGPHNIVTPKCYPTSFIRS